MKENRRKFQGKAIKYNNQNNEKRTAEKNLRKKQKEKIKKTMRAN